jgi:hypothetical protein
MLKIPAWLFTVLGELYVYVYVENAVVNGYDGLHMVSTHILSTQLGGVFPFCAIAADALRLYTPPATEEKYAVALYVSGCWEACRLRRPFAVLMAVVEEASVEPNVTSKKLELLAGGAIGGLSSGLTTCATT